MHDLVDGCRGSVAAADPVVERHLTGDPPAQAARATRYLQDADELLLPDLILAEVNIKEIEYITDTDGVIHKKAKPNFKTLGKKLGKNMKAAGEIILGLDQATISTIEKNNLFILEIEGEKIELTLDIYRRLPEY